MASSFTLAFVSLTVHVILLASIFDIYFTSQVETGLKPYYYDLQPPAKRLVLFVADGLRADTIFSITNERKTNAPFLRDVVERRGRWGVSHTRVPTESRPGHVALIAGLYEDVSAVTRGWQENPVVFDSVFNRSRHTWSWGSPDILPMFAQGATHNKVDAIMYDAAWEDFADSDASKLDSWVFDKVEKFFDQAHTNYTLASQLAQDKNVFFLHLLGIDTNGHAHRPYSREVIDNLKFVDSKIENVEKLVNSYFGDDKTAFVFTSDHGMTDWGSHGAGLPEETMTPLICWGAGLKNARSNVYAEKVYHDGYSEKWQLDRIERVDVAQADIATLMATLIGVAIPVNSEGVLPIRYIHYNKGFIAAAMETNSLQFFDQVEQKKARLHTNSLPLLFRPFPKMSSSLMADKQERIGLLRRQKQYQMSIDLSIKQIELYQEALRYYHTYHRSSLFLTLSLGFFGWMFCVITHVFKDSVPLNEVQHMDRRFPYKNFLLLCAVYFLLFLQSSPFFYYLYYSLALFTWSFVWRSKRILLQSLSVTRTKFISLFVIFIVVIVGLELVVLSFFYRQVWSLILILASIWPYFTDLKKTESVLCALWTLVCISLSIFPLLPVVGRSANYNFVILAGLVMFLTSVVFMCIPTIRYTLCFSSGKSKWMERLLVFQTILLLLSTFVPTVANWYFINKKPIPFVLNLFSWFILLNSIVSPFIGPTSVPGRIFHLVQLFFTNFLLLSTSFEAVFVLILCCCLYLWLALENALLMKSKKYSFWNSVLSFRKSKAYTIFPNELENLNSGVSISNLRQILICIILGIFSYFGTGNIASINTFDPATVYCFLTVFSPFVMGGLILWKMTIPFLLIGSVFNIVVTTSNCSLRSYILAMILLSDIMGLNFFFLVRDSGSWLEIGISISHYVIMMAMSIGIVILVGIARLLTGLSIVSRKTNSSY